MRNLNDIKIAYFSMEIGIDEDMPSYSGGLGILAGDTLRSMADLEIPVVGISLLYHKGYFRQKIDQDGNQIEEEVQWDPRSKLKQLSNHITVKIEGRNVMVKAWIYNINGISGRVNPIVFLDTDVHGNSDYDRSLTHHLYGNDHKYRLAQEIVLGIGGVRMLKALGYNNIKKYHMNEGHSALLTLELAKMAQAGENYLGSLRGKCVFTTHTPVAAGHDAFDRGLAEELLGDYLTDQMKEDVFVEGKLNMTHLGLKYSEFVNGVAKKHGEVSRTMFLGHHIESITNGVHSNFWTCQEFHRVFDKYIPGWQADPFYLRYVLGVPKDEIFDAHQQAKQKLLDYVNEKYKMSMKPEIFTIGFARRAATYKRANLLLADPERLVKIAEKFGGIQIIYGGKAHPNDFPGKDLIKDVIHKLRKLSDKIQGCYLENYNIKLAKKFLPGVDIWMNTPQRPKEASGTSGMKAAHNGVPHFSILDGWWLEGHISGVTGWSIGVHPNISIENNWDDDMNDLYDKLENEILPIYYQDRQGWIDIMQHAIAINGSFFNTHRMVQQYVLNAYF